MGKRAGQPRRVLIAAAGMTVLVSLAMISGGKMTHALVPPPKVKEAQVLFKNSAKDMQANWVQYGSDKPADWKMVNGAMEVRDHDIETKDKFTNYHLHIEFREPYMPDKHGQERGNSGIFLCHHYEIQVLDSYGIADPGQGDCGAVYSQAAPLINACKPPLEWQTYDIIFRAPRKGDDGSILEKAHVTVIQNGILVQNNQEIKGPTDGYEMKPDDDYSLPAPIRLQNHGTKVQYRNIWIVPVPPQGAQHY